MQENIQHYSNLRLRIIVALILIPIVIGILLTSTILFQIMLVFLALGMLNEWYDMTSTKIFYLCLGLFIIAIPMSCLLLLTINVQDYQYPALTYCIMIWMIDTCAMFGGKNLQGPKLAAVLSPNKTWSGLICGMIGSAITVLICYKSFGQVFIYEGLEVMVFGMVFAIIAQISDLFISFFKRKFNLKDSSDIIPGHGGILDRCDSLILTAPLILYVTQ